MKFYTFMGFRWLSSLHFKTIIRLYHLLKFNGEVSNLLFLQPAFLHKTLLPVR